MSVAAGTAAGDAGLLPGETIEAVDGRPARGVDAFRDLIASSPGRELSLTLVNEAGDTRVVAVAPRSDATTGEPRGLLGVGLGVRADERVIIEHPDPIRSLAFGAGQTWTIISMTVDYLGQIVTGRASGRDIAGPVGIFMHSGTVTQNALAAPQDTSFLDIAGRVALSLLGWAALLSVAVGFVNLLPIPILDGGHLVFYAVEAVRGGRPLPAIAQEWAFRAGLVMMAGLFLFATWNDISRGLASATG
jgi:regulator of sigma E protease